MKTHITLIVLFLVSFHTVFAAKTSASLNADNSIFSALINQQNIVIETYGNNCFRILKYPANKQFSKQSFSVIRKQGDALIKLRETSDEFILTGIKVQIIINKKSAEIRFADTSGKTLLTEIKNKQPFVPVTDINGSGFKVKQQFRFAENEGIYGLGQDQRGIMNFRNQSVWLKQRNMFIAIPFLISTKGYGILWDNSSITTFSDNSSDGAYFESEIGDAIDYYFIVGKNMDNVIASYRNLTGEAPMFPKWVFGFLQSRERYVNQQEIVDIVRKYRELNLPIDGIVQDWRYWGFDEGQWNSTEFDKDNFPNPKKMMDEIHALNAHTMISVWPSFGNTSNIYKELEGKNLLYGFKTFPNTGKEKVYDAFSSEARYIYWKYLQKNIFSIGMDSWWLDATEPEQSDPLSKIDSTQTAMGSYKRVANAFPLVTNMGVYENQRKTSSEKRVFILTRSAFAGQQRYAAASWSGDIRADWNVFRNQISGGINFSLSGIPYWTTDIGAFTIDQDTFPGGCKNLLYQELYVRWFQFGVFCPLFRSHGSNTPREVFNFGEKGYWAYDIQEKYLKLRYRLLPYIYSLSWKITSEGASMMRGMFMDYPDDTIAQHLNNQYFFGPSILVAPVTEQQYSHINKNDGKVYFNQNNLKQTKVYLPKDDWFDFWTGEIIAGGKYVNRSTPIDIIPLYVRAGSVIAMAMDSQYATEKNNNMLEIRIYQGKDGEFVLYEDENDNYNYEKGKFSKISFNWNENAQTLVIGKRIGQFTGMSVRKTFKIVFVSRNQGAGDQLTQKVFKTVEYCGQEIRIKKKGI
jgi:alpha-D-xyloside xylohydrolase